MLKRVQVMTLPNYFAGIRGSSVYDVTQRSEIITLDRFFVDSPVNSTYQKVSLPTSIIDETTDFLSNLSGDDNLDNPSHNVYHNVSLATSMKSKTTDFQSNLPANDYFDNPSDNAYQNVLVPTSMESKTNNFQSNLPGNNDLQEIETLIDLATERTERLRLVDQRCGHTASTKMISTRSLTQILVDSQHKVLYCSVPKCGTTSWLLMVAYLSGKVDITLTTQEENQFNAWKREEMARIGIKYLNKYPPQTAMGYIKDYYKFLIVRNPYERLISAYTDKFNNVPDRSYYHTTYGKTIIRLFRKNATREALKQGNDVTFPEFISFVIYQWKRRLRFDEHWKPITDTCLPCSIRWDKALQWRHNERDAISNHRNLDCLLNHLFRLRQRKHQSFASLPFVRRIHRWPTNSRHKGPETRKCFVLIARSWGTDRQLIWHIGLKEMWMRV